MNAIERALELEPLNEEYVHDKALMLWELQGTAVGLDFVNTTLKLLPESTPLRLLQSGLCEDQERAKEEKSKWMDGQQWQCRQPNEDACECVR